MRPTVSVIVVNWNGAKLLPGCLASLKAQTFKDVELIVVDNGSTDGSADGLKDCVVIRLPKNRGFARGNNEGICAAHGEYIALLNNDARANRFWLGELVRAAEKHPKAGMFASKVLTTSGKIDSAGCTVWPDGNGMCRGRGEVGGNYAKQELVTFPSGCAAMYRRKMLDEIGIFDDRFFMYNEDTDLGVRGQRAGWKCIYVPTAIATHLYSQSSSAYSLKKLFYVERNRILLILKNFSFDQIFFSPLFTAIRYFKMITGGRVWSE